MLVNCDMTLINNINHYRNVKEYNNNSQITKTSHKILKNSKFNERQEKCFNRMRRGAIITMTM